MGSTSTDIAHFKGKLERAFETQIAQLAQMITTNTGDPRSPEQVAEGFLYIAIDNMANAIKKISIQRGHLQVNFAEAHRARYGFSVADKPLIVENIAVEIEEESVLIDDFQIVDQGRFLEEGTLNLLQSDPYPARNPTHRSQNLAGNGRFHRN